MIDAHWVLLGTSIVMLALAVWQPNKDANLTVRRGRFAMCACGFLALSKLMKGVAIGVYFGGPLENALFTGIVAMPLIAYAFDLPKVTRQPKLGSAI